MASEGLTAQATGLRTLWGQGALKNGRNPCYWESSRDVRAKARSEMGRVVPARVLPLPWALGFCPEAALFWHPTASNSDLAAWAKQVRHKDLEALLYNGKETLPEDGIVFQSGEMGARRSVRSFMCIIPLNHMATCQMGQWHRDKLFSPAFLHLLP